MSHPSVQDNRSGPGTAGPRTDPHPQRSREDFDRLVRERARSLGFARVGVARADMPLERDYERYQAFVESGKHGEMAYLAENQEARRRLDRASILEGAKSVICVAESYAADSSTGGAPRREPHTEPARGLPLEPMRTPRALDGIARYARGRDYHKHLRKRLRKLAAFVRGLAPGVRARPMTDTAPVLERTWASRAGLGFVGKNGMLITPGVGSFVLLGEVVTTLELTPGVPIGERCGSCTACLDACPTAAFDAPYVLDPRRCVSYLTIELRGPMPEALRPLVGEHLFGCDVCQEVCPFNRPSLSRREPLHEAYASLDRWTELSVGDLASLDEEAWATLQSCSPLGRATKAGIERNAVTVLANTGDPRYTPLLERVASSHPDPVVREHAAWGLGRLGDLARTTDDRETP